MITQETLIIILLITLIAPLLFCFMLIFFLWFRLIQIYIMIRRYPKLISRTLIFIPSDNKFLNFLKLLRITFQQGFTFIAFSREKYDKSFNALFDYSEMKKSGDKQLLKMLYSYKRWSRVYLWIFNLYFVGITGIAVIGFVIALLIR